MKFLSSIFSSETLESIRMPRHWLASLALLAIILIGAEVAARIALAPVGDNLWAYRPPASSRVFEWYRHLATNSSVPDVVAIGDSVGARNFDPQAFIEASGMGSVYSLAQAGNFPLALQSNTLPLLTIGDAPGTVILLQWAGSFRDDPRVRQIESGARSPILEARREGRKLVTDYLYVTRLFPARSHLFNYWINGKDLLPQPVGGGFKPFQQPPDDRPRPAITAVSTTEHVSFSAERRNVVSELLEIARERQFRVIAVVGPLYGPDGDNVASEHVEWLKALEISSCGAMAVLDMRRASYLEPRHFKDNNHLFADGAAKFSAYLADRVVAEIGNRDGVVPAECN
jgi:hypothetical protein